MSSEPLEQSYFHGKTKTTWTVRQEKERFHKEVSTPHIQRTILSGAKPPKQLSTPVACKSVQQGQVKASKLEVSKLASKQENKPSIQPLNQRRIGGLRKKQQAAPCLKATR
eukprot:3845975-Amphidinium_carterae.1